MLPVFDALVIVSFCWLAKSSGKLNIQFASYVFGLIVMSGYAGFPYWLYWLSMLCMLAGYAGYAA